MKSKKIIIYNVHTYMGGPLVLSCLCQTLRRNGYDALLFMGYGFIRNSGQVHSFWKHYFIQKVKNTIKSLLCDCFPHVRAFDKYRTEITSISMDGLKFVHLPLFSKKNSIVIYPEYMYGNPLKADNVVRWLLLYYRFEDDPNAYGKNDLFIAYRQVFNSPKLNPDCQIVHLHTFDSNLYRQYNFGERQGNCYILRKGRNRTDLPNHFDGPVFDDNMSQKEMVAMFNNSKYCYSYDTQTAYSSIAAVCGCISIVVMEPGKTEKDYLGPGENHYGVAYGDSDEQIQYALATKDKLLESLDSTEENNRNALHLVELLENKFGPIRRL